jgi:hypothetical protein
MAREELKWQNIDADDLPADVKQSFDAMIEAEAAFKAKLEKVLRRKVTCPRTNSCSLAGRGTSWCRVYTSTPPLLWQEYHLVPAAMGHSPIDEFDPSAAQIDL